MIKLRAFVLVAGSSGEAFSCRPLKVAEVFKVNVISPLPWVSYLLIRFEVFEQEY